VEFLFPTLLDSDRPHLLAYTAESIVAEKLEAMLALDMANTRLKDFVDLWTLALGTEFSGPLLTQTVRATLERRKTPIPTSTPIALTSSFYDDPTKKTQWRSFLRKANVEGAPEQLAEVVRKIEEFVGPVLEAINANASLERRWPPGGPWSQ